MPLRTRTKKSFSERTSLRTLRSKATETRLTSIDPESLIDPPPPLVPELVTTAISASAEAVMTMHGSALGTAATAISVSAEAVATMAGSSSGIETGQFSFAAEGVVTFGGQSASNAADFSSTAESSMVFVGVEQSIASGDWSSTAESVMTLQGSFIGGISEGDLFTGAEASMSMIGTTVDAAETNISISAESVMTIGGAALAASNISVIAESVSTLRGASINPSRLFSAGEASAVMQSDDTAIAGVYTEGPLAAQQVPPYTAYLTYLNTWENWLGTDVVMAQDFISYGGGATTAANWAKIDTPTYLYGWGTWKAAVAGREVMIRVPMAPFFVAPDTLPTDLCAQIASGTYDSRWQTLATNLNNNGLGSAHLRIGFRMNASGEPWYSPPGSSNASNFAAAYRRIVDVMEAQVPGNDWKFSIAVEAEAASNGLSWWNLIWPGDAYVHKIGIHIYDQSWLFGTTVSYIDSTMSEATKATRRAQVWDQINGWLLFIRDFAIAHNKVISFDEWALVQRTDNHGGGDNPSFVQNIYDFMNVPGNRVFSQCYTNTNWASDLRCELNPSASNNPTGVTDFPNAEDKYIELFGEQPPPSGASTLLGLWSGRPVSKTDSAQAWVGTTLMIQSEWLTDSGGWGTVQSASHIFTQGYQAWMAAVPGRNIMIGVHMGIAANDIKSGGSMTPTQQLQEIASGVRDSVYQTLATNLINNGFGSCYLRPGWEMDGNWYPWRTRPHPSDPPGATTGAKEAFASAFRRIVNVMRTRSAELGISAENGFKFAICPTNDRTVLSQSWLDTVNPDQPGTNFQSGMNYIHHYSIDIYDYYEGYLASMTQAQKLSAYTSGGKARNFDGLNLYKNWALSKGKSISFGECGLYRFLPVPSANGGDDNHLFIQDLSNFQLDPANQCLFAAWFNLQVDANLDTKLQPPTFMPNSSALFKTMWGP